MIITEEMLDALRRQVSEGMSLRRFVHTAEVEKMAAYLGSIYAPDKIPLLRAAALLHDVTKEYPQETQIELCREYGVELEADAYFAPKTLHARTAAAIIPEKFPDFADAEIISCVRYHTTGRADMTLSMSLCAAFQSATATRRVGSGCRISAFCLSAMKMLPVTASLRKRWRSRPNISKAEKILGIILRSSSSGSWGLALLRPLIVPTPCLRIRRAES